MRVVRQLFASALVGITLAGCFSGRVHRPVESGGHDLITQQELDRVAELTMLEAVSKLRPHFLRNRSVTAHGRAASRQMMLYVDGEKMDSIDDLRRLSPTQVQEVRFYEPQLANTYFARYNNAGGAIAIKLRKLDG